MCYYDFTRLMGCFLDTGLGNLWEVPMEGSHIHFLNESVLNHTVLLICQNCEWVVF
jgi:hypothetical protein